MVGVRDHLKVGGIVETVLKYLPVRGYRFRMLLREFSFEIGVDIVQGPVIYEACHAQGEHVLALVHRFLVHPEILEALFGERGDRGDDKVAVLHMELQERIVGLESGLAQACFIEGVRIHENHGIALAPFGIGHERGGIHRHEQVAEITGGVNRGIAYMNLESRHSGDRSVRCADFCGVIGKSGK